jgi:predicted esterase
MDCELNNENIYGEIVLPDNFEGKLPMVILSHGLTATHDRMKDCAKLLEGYGIASYIFDFRGGSYESSSDGLVEDMTVSSEVDDLNAVFDMVKGLSFVDKDNLYLLGHSQGGLVSALVANNRVCEVKGLFLVSPAFIIPEISNELRIFSKSDKDDLKLYNSSSISDWWFSEGKDFLGDDYLVDSGNISLFDDVVGFNKHVCIFHCIDDMIVPLSYIICANDAYSDCELIVLNDESHLFTSEGEEIIVKKVSDVIKNDL